MQKQRGREMAAGRLSWPRYLKRNYSLYLMVAPGVLVLLLFHYVPIYGILMAFQKFMPAKGIWGSKWVGLKHFTRFFDSPYFGRLLGNTFTLGALGLLITHWAPLLFALLLNEILNERFKKSVQTISYMPYFISTVIIIGILKDMTSVSGGVINEVIAALGGQKINFFSNSGWFRPMYIITAIWSGMGYSAIIYLAAISGINPELYESAVIDGASRFQQMLHVTLPCISSTIVVLLILAAGGIVGNDCSKILLMQSPLTYETSDVISTYVYREGILGGGYSYTTAIGLFTSLISLVFLLATNWAARRIGEESIF